MRGVAGVGCLGIVCGQDALPRNVIIKDQQFLLSATGAPIVLSGPNVVVKGPPYLPAVSGDTMCNDIVNSECAASGSCSSCTTFNQADIDNIKSSGWNFIRLGVTWAGAQPRDEDVLDPDFTERLHAILNLTDANGIHVMLDNHGDMVGSAGCGNGIPMWFSQEAAPTLIGKRLRTTFPYNQIPQLTINNVPGYDHCGRDAGKWAQYAGDPNYNLLNECCQALNSNWNEAGIGWTSMAQQTMDYSIKPGTGRDKFVRYWRLMAEAVKQHPSAFAFELQNEPITIQRAAMFETWRVATVAINEVIPDASVSFSDVGEESILPAFVTQIAGNMSFEILPETVEWIKASKTSFFSWHYGSAPDNINNVQALGEAWNVPTFGTELHAFDGFDVAAAANISHSYWHYSVYCNTGSHFGNRTVPTDTFGACILGWDGAYTSRPTESAKVTVVV